MEHEETNAATADSAGSDAESTASASVGGPPPPPEPMQEPGKEDRGPTLAGQVAAGLTLMALGAALLALERLDGSAQHLLLILVGGVFAAGYFYKTAFGLLIPGGILIGLGAGLAYDSYSDSFAGDESAAFGLGLGFLLIYVVSLLYERVNRWWPLIPGGVLVVAGFPEWDWADAILDYWPVAVMAVGLFLLLRGILARQKREESRRF